MKLEGLPKGFRAVRWGLVKPGEWIAHGEHPFRPLNSLSYPCLIVEPDTEGGDDDNIRPFVDSEDFIEAARGMLMVLNITTGNLETVLFVDDTGIETIRGAISYERLMVEYEFSDGRACGYED